MDADKRAEQLLSDDITFCGNNCVDTKCRRHPTNIQDLSIPHSFAYLLGTEDCRQLHLMKARQHEARARECEVEE